MGLMLLMTENEGDGDRGKDDNLHRWGMEQKNKRGGSGQYEGRDAVDDCTFTAVSAAFFAFFDAWRETC